MAAACWLISPEASGQIVLRAPVASPPSSAASIERTSVECPETMSVGDIFNLVGTVTAEGEGVFENLSFEANVSVELDAEPGGSSKGEWAELDNDGAGGTNDATLFIGPVQNESVTFDVDISAVALGSGSASFVFKENGETIQSESCTIQVVQQADLALSLESLPAAVAGEPWQLAFTYSNLGPGASGVAGITIQLTEYLQIESAVAGGEACAVSDQTVTCTIAPLEPGAGGTGTIQTVVNPAAGGIGFEVLADFFHAEDGYLDGIQENNRPDSFVIIEMPQGLDDAVLGLVGEVCPSPERAEAYLRAGVLTPEDEVASYDPEELFVVVEEPTYMAWIDCEPEERFSHVSAVVLFDPSVPDFVSNPTVEVINWWPEINGTVYPSRVDGEPDTSERILTAPARPFTFTNTSTITSSGPEPRAGDRVCAVLVSGQARYQGEQQMFDRDVDIMRANLVEEWLGPGLEPSKVDTLKNADASRVSSTIAGLTGKCDKIYFYYSGHGGGFGDEGMVLRDGTYTYERLAAALLETGAEEICILIDACFSGTAEDALRSNPLFAQRNVTLLTSSSRVRQSGNVLIENQITRDFFTAGFFSYFLARCWGDPDADLDRDGYVTWTESFEWLKTVDPAKSDGTRLMEQDPQLVFSRPYLTVEKSASVESTVESGDTFAFTVTLTNTSEDQAVADVLVVDPLPATVTFLSATASKGACVNPGPNAALTCYIGSIDPGEVVTVTINVRAGAVGDASNVVTAGGTDSPRAFVTVVQTFSICGEKFFDLDGDGQRDEDEPGVDGFVIELLDDGGRTVATTSTASEDLDGDGQLNPETEQGRFCFRGLDPGTYTIREVASSSWTQTFPAPPGSHEVTIATGSQPRIQFGNKPRFTEEDPPVGPDDELLPPTVPPTRPPSVPPPPPPEFLGLDFGDLPDPRRDLSTCPGPLPCYPTRFWSGGPVHVLGQGLVLGALVDWEWDGQPTDPADGDDVNLSGLGFVDDEDGLLSATVQADGSIRFEVFVTLFPPIETAFIDGFVDRNDDGLLSIVADYVLISVPVFNGLNVLTTAPGTVASGFAGFVRLRLSSAGGLGPTGIAADGEVEDYFLSGADFGDAPATRDPERTEFPAGYPTTLAQDGARHALYPSIRLGGLIDSRANVFGSLDALEDDLDRQQDDEDGISFLSGFEVRTDAELGEFVALSQDSDVYVLPLPSTDGFLDAWVDWNRDGDWDDQNERVIASENIGPEMDEDDALPVRVPADASLGYTYARFRFSGIGGLEPFGAAPNGEVEDYLFEVVEPGVVADTEEEEPTLPDRFELGQNYPNPFNPTTTIRFDLAEPSPVRLTVFDAVGKRLAVLVDDTRPAGRHAVTFDASELPSGVYFYRIEAGTFVATRHMVLLE